MLFYAEPVHCSAEETSLVEGTADLEDVTFDLHRAVVGLAVTWVVDCSSRSLGNGVMKKGADIKMPAP